MGKHLLFALALVAMAIVSSPATIGTDGAILSALDISGADLTRLKWAVGHHQELTDSTTHEPRLATSAEAIAELKSRINEFVRREEAKAGRDTLGQWGGI